MRDLNKLIFLNRLKRLRRLPAGSAIKSFYPQSEILDVDCDGGMTLFEMLLAMSMLIVFTGVVVMVMEFTNRFFVDAEGAGKGVLIEHAEIQIDMDRLVEVLSQPGVSHAQIQGFSSPHSTSLPTTCVVSGGDIALAWNLPIPPTSLTPDGYSLCLWSTNPSENASSPGIYVLQALPDNLSASKLPTRRIFCRPRHLC